MSHYPPLPNFPPTQRRKANNTGWYITLGVLLAAIFGTAVLLQVTVFRYSTEDCIRVVHTTGDLKGIATNRPEECEHLSEDEFSQVVMAEIIDRLELDLL